MPLFPFIPILSGLAAVFMLTRLSGEMWLVAGIWFLIGIAIYFSYGYWHSQLNDKQ